MRTFAHIILAVALFFPILLLTNFIVNMAFSNQLSLGAIFIKGCVFGLAAYGSLDFGQYPVRGSSGGVAAVFFWLIISIFFFLIEFSFKFEWGMDRSSLLHYISFSLIFISFSLGTYNYAKNFFR